MHVRRGKHIRQNSNTESSFTTLLYPVQKSAPSQTKAEDSISEQRAQLLVSGHEPPLPSTGSFQMRRQRQLVVDRKYLFPSSDFLIPAAHLLEEEEGRGRPHSLG